jgi:hypothetical protein
LRWQVCCTGEVLKPDAVAWPLKYFHASIKRCPVGVAPFASSALIALVSEARLESVMSCTGKR